MAKGAVSCTWRAAPYTASRLYRLGDFGLSKYTAAGGVTAMPEELGAALTARAQIYETDGATSGIVGTSAYISPEIEKVRTGSFNSTHRDSHA